eukprot:193197-Pelagomonas_calceolata.AAC.4
MVTTGVNRQPPVCAISNQALKYRCTFGLYQKQLAYQPISSANALIIFLGVLTKPSLGLHAMLNLCKPDCRPRHRVVDAQSLPMAIY